MSTKTHAICVQFSEDDNDHPGKTMDNVCINKKLFNVSISLLTKDAFFARLYRNGNSALTCN